MDWVIVEAISAATSTLVLIVASVIAWRQYREAVRFREENQTRPFVVIEFRTEASSLIFIRVSNLGSTMAREVRFVIDPPLRAKRGGNELQTLDLNIFKSGIESLAPGRTIEFFFDSWIGRVEKDDYHRVTISYKGPEKRVYKDELDLDLGVFRNMTFIHRHDLDDIYKKLDDMAGTLKGFKPWSGDGLLVVTPEDVAKRVEEIEQTWKARQAELDARTPTPPDTGQGATEPKTDETPGS